MEPRRLLIVDDDAAMRRVLERSFDRAGFHVEAVASSEEAFERLRASSFDAVIAAAPARRHAGRELTERIRRAGGSPPFVFLVTSRSGPDERRWIARIERAELVERPVGPRTLVRLVTSKVSPDGRTDADRERVA